MLAASAAAVTLAGPGERSLVPLDFVTIAAATASLAFLYAAAGRLFGTAPVNLKGAG
jgi:hypothetical protein